MGDQSFSMILPAVSPYLIKAMLEELASMEAVDGG